MSYIKQTSQWLLVINLLYLYSALYALLGTKDVIHLHMTMLDNPCSPYTEVKHWGLLIAPIRLLL